MLEKTRVEYPRLLISDTFAVLKITLSEAGGVIGNAHTRTELLVPDTGLHVILISNQSASRQKLLH